MNELIANVGTFAGVFVSGLSLIAMIVRVIDRIDARKALLKADQAQRDALEKIPPLSVLLLIFLLSTMLAVICCAHIETPSKFAAVSCKRDADCDPGQYCKAKRCVAVATAMLFFPRAKNSSTIKDYTYNGN